MHARSNENELLDLAEKIKTDYTPAQIGKLIRLIEPAPCSALMSNHEFERVMEVLVGQSTKRPYSEKSIAAARLVLVKGASIAEAAEEVGLARQVVHRLMQRVRRRLESLPSDWVKVNDWFPREVAKQLSELAAELGASQQKGETMGNMNFIVSLSRADN